MHNKDVRNMAAGNGVRLWQIAEALGFSDCNFSRKLRKELSAEEKQRIFGIIETLAREGNG